MVVVMFQVTRIAAHVGEMHDTEVVVRKEVTQEALNSIRSALLDHGWFSILLTKFTVALSVAGDHCDLVSEFVM
jgi:hypothetical protein